MNFCENRLKAQDWITALLLGAVALMLRVPLRGRIAFDWDCAQFALAIEHFDIAKSLPHPPGYFLYVMLGRLVNLIVGEPHAALVWISVVCGSALVAVIYLLGTAMFGRATGWIAALVGMTSPLLWFYSLVARTYVVDGVTVTVFALLCWNARARGVGWWDVVVLSFMLAFAMGLRQQTGLTLLPLFLYTVWAGRPYRGLRIVIALLLVGAFVLAWLIPLLINTGGLHRYLELAHAHLQAHGSGTVWNGGLMAVLRNLARMVAFVIEGLLLGTPLLGMAYLSRVRSIAGIITRGEIDDRFRFFAIWLGPMIVFWASVYTDIPGHVVSYLCGITVLVGVSVVDLAGEIAARTGGNGSSRYIKVLLTAIMVGVNSWVFLCRPDAAIWFMRGDSVTYPDVRDNDRQLAGVFRLVREHFTPEQVVVCHALEFHRWNFRQFQYHLPEYRTVQLQPDSSLPIEYSRKMWLGFQKRTEFTDKLDQSDRRTLLLLVPPGWSPDIFLRYFDLSGMQPVEGANGRLYTLPAQALRDPSY